MTEGKKLLILGFGGHARSVADVALACGYRELVFVDEHARDGENFLGHPVVSKIDPYVGHDWDAFPASGDNRKREMQCVIARELGFFVATLLSPKASVGVGASISIGCFVGHHAHVGPGARVHSGCIINTSAVIEHESEIGNFCHVSVHATVAGRSKLGAYSLLGAGAVIIDGIDVIENTVIGAGAVICKSIATPGIYVGVPAVKMS